MSPPDLEILACEPTPLGILCLRRRRLPSEPGTVVTEVTLAGTVRTDWLYFGLA